MPFGCLKIDSKLISVIFENFPTKTYVRMFPRIKGQNSSVFFSCTFALHNEKLNCMIKDFCV